MNNFTVPYDVVDAIAGCKNVTVRTHSSNAQEVANHKYLKTFCAVPKRYYSV